MNWTGWSLHKERMKSASEKIVIPAVGLSVRITYIANIYFLCQSSSMHAQCVNNNPK